MNVEHSPKILALEEKATIFVTVLLVEAARVTDSPASSVLSTVCARSAF